MTSFFSVSHNSFSKRGFPWGARLGLGYRRLERCLHCGANGLVPREPIELLLRPDKGMKWPDALGCGAYPLFIVSRRVVDDWRADGVGEFPSHRLEILTPYPKRLSDSEPPDYVWLDGDQVTGARLDFEASGFVDVKFCPVCGDRTDDIQRTDDRQNEEGCPYAFVAGSWNGANLFTTDLSPYQFFCTDQVLDCARRHRHTNFRFIPVEEGSNTFSAGLKYL